MAFLTPCESCQRHVRTTDDSCPFCGAHVTNAMRARRPRVAKGRLGRAALMAIGATVASATACAGDSEDEGTHRGPAEETPGEPHTMAPSSTDPGSAGDPGAEPEPEPMYNADYGSPIMEPEYDDDVLPDEDDDVVVEPSPSGDAGAAVEDEPTFAAEYGVPALPLD